MSDERRKDQRLAVDLLFTYELAEGQQGPGPEPEREREVPMIKDVSRGGAKIFSEKRIAMGSLLEVAIMPLLVPGIMRMTGKVVWAKEKCGLGNYYGVQFIQFASGCVEILEGYLEKLRLTPPAELKKMIQEAEKMAEF